MVCVCGEWVGGVREREREEGDRRAAVEQQRGTKERGKRENFPGVQWLGCLTFTAGVKAGS